MALKGEQIPIMNDADPPYVPLTNAKPTLTDLLTIEPSASIFFSYARELQLSTMFSDIRKKSTVFVPTNKAVMALARKPHKGPVSPVDEGIEISEQEYDELSRKNVERWVSAHIVPESPITLGSHPHNTLLPGKSITSTSIPKNDGRGPEWSRMTLEDGIRIIGMTEGLNGVIYLIDGTIAYD